MVVSSYGARYPPLFCLSGPGLAPELGRAGGQGEEGAGRAGSIGDQWSQPVGRNVEIARIKIF